MVGLIILAVVVVLALAVVIWYFSCYNSFVRLKNNYEEAFSTMDVSMKKRYDLIPNIVETVKGFAKHEKETLDAVISARANALKAGAGAEKIKAEKEFGGAIRNLIAVAESYPDLKANANFLDLQSQLRNIETEIANSRKYYNACVKTFNTKVESFPSSIVARSRGFNKAALFELDNPEERKNVKVQF